MASSSGMPSTSGSQWSNTSSESLDGILSTRQGLQSLLELSAQDTAVVIDVLDRSLDSPAITPSQRKKYTAAMRKLCGACGMLPTSHIVTEGLEVVEDRPYASGGFADVWQGKFKGQKVAIKALRIFVTDDLVKIKKKFFKEALGWKRLSHPNVLQFLGVSTGTSGFQFCMVSVWMEHGSVVEYVKANPGANSLVLLSDIAAGLFYLHGIGLVHGDLKGANILIDSDFRACLADFGLMTIIPDSHTIYSTATAATQGGTVRWMAPELLSPEDYGFESSNPSKASDIYAIGMVIYEVMTGTMPFNKYGKFAVAHKVMSGARPGRPTHANVFGLTDAVWGLMEACWHQQSNERPLVSTVLSRLNEASHCWNQASLTTAGVEQESHDSDASSVISDDVFETQLRNNTTHGSLSSEAVQPTTARKHSPARPSTPATYDKSPYDEGESPLPPAPIPQMPATNIQEPKPEPEVVSQPASSISEVTRAMRGSSLCAIVLRSYQAVEENEMDLVEGELIEQIKVVDDSRWSGVGDNRRKTGLFPANYVEKVQQPEGEEEAEQQAAPPPAPSRSSSLSQSLSQPPPATLSQLPSVTPWRLPSETLSQLPDAIVAALREHIAVISSNAIVATLSDIATTTRDPIEAIAGDPIAATSRDPIAAALSDAILATSSDAIAVINSDTIAATTNDAIIAISREAIAAITSDAITATATDAITATTRDAIAAIAVAIAATARDSIEATLRDAIATTISDAMQVPPETVSRLPANTRT